MRIRNALGPFVGCKGKGCLTELQWRTQRVGKGDISLPLSDPGSPFRLKLSSAATFHCQHLVKIRKLKGSEGPDLFCKPPFEASESPSQAREGVFKARDGLFKNIVGKQRPVLIRFCEGPTRPGALPWLISSPSSELWLHRC